MIGIMIIPQHRPNQSLSNSTSRLSSGECCSDTLRVGQPGTSEYRNPQYVGGLPQLGGLENACILFFVNDALISCEISKNIPLTSE